MTGGTLIFSNSLDACLEAVDALITGGTVRHAANSATTTNIAGGWPVDGCVYFQCTNFTLQAPGIIDVNERGWGAPLSGSASGYGPGAGGTRSGGGYGGGGGSYAKTGGRPYGAVDAPDQPGSGGGPFGTVKGGFGGGLVRIEAQGGTATLNGTIRANGGTGGANAGGGSGGGIFISCLTLAGTNGLVTANGGDRNGTSGSAGGGRIAVAYDPAAQSSAVPCTVTFSVRPGAFTVYPGDLGTLWFPDNALLQETVKHTGQWLAPGNVWMPASLTVTNGWIRFPAAGMRLAVTGDVTVTGTGAGLELGGNSFVTALYREGIYMNYVIVSDMTNAPALTAGGDLLLTNGGFVRLYGAPTNGSPWGALLAVTGNMVVASTSVLYLFSDPTNGGSVCVSASNVTVLSGGSINANMAGFAPGRLAVNGEQGFGPGGGVSKGGGGYGGFGGNMSDNGGRPYGDAGTPRFPGSGGGNDGVSYSSGAGGGLVWIEAADRIRVDGLLTANGGDPGGNAGGGSGGGIYLACRAFASDGGTIRANGANSDNVSGSGGGGRVAIVYDSGEQQAVDPVDVKLLASGGTFSYKADLGTIWLPDSRFLREEMNVEGQLRGFSSWAPGGLSVSNRWVRFPDGFALTVTNDVVLIGTNALLDLGGNRLFDIGSFRMENTVMTGLIRYSAEISSLAIGGDLVLTNGGDMTVYAGPTNPISPHGASITVGGVARLYSGSWIFPVSEPTNGGSALFTLASLSAVSASGFNADQSGFAGGGGTRQPGYGYGAGGYQGGGGYGGSGGGVNGGDAYGESNAPAFPGSGGGRGSGTTTSYNGGLGGGLVRLVVAGNILLDGTLTAIGRNGAASGGSGAGSGGGIYVQCRRLAGSGVLTAKGGNGGGGGSASGGGGQIAVLASSRAGFTGSASAPAGTTYYLGTTGTVVWLDRKLPGTVMLVR